MPLFALEPATDQTSAWTIFTVIAANAALALYSRWQARGVKKVAAAVATSAETATTIVTNKVDDIYTALNGTGIAGALKKIVGRLDNHDEQLIAVNASLTEVTTTLKRGIVIPPDKGSPT